MSVNEAVLAQYATTDALANRRNLYQYAIGPSLTDVIADHLHGYATMSFLDVGCGYGTDLAAFIERYPGGKAVGIDQSAGMIAEAKTKAPAAGLIVDDVGTFNLPKKFDRILARHVLHLVDNPQAAIANILSHCKPGGRAVFVLHSTRSQPRFSSWLSWFQLQTGITYSSPSDALTVDAHADIFRSDVHRAAIADAVAVIKLPSADPYITYIEGQKRWSRQPSAEELTMLVNHVRAEIDAEIAAKGHFEELSINGIITVDYKLA